MLRFLLVFVTVGALCGVECPGTWHARAAHPFTVSESRITAVALSDGRVLAVGMQAGRPASAVYDPDSDSWSGATLIPLLPVPGLDESVYPGRDPLLPPDTLVVYPESLTVMPDGGVVAIANGGRFWAWKNPEDVQPTESIILVALHWSGAEWTIGGTVADSRHGFAAARLGADRIIAVGGANFRHGAPGRRAIIYDVPTRTWTQTPDNWPGPEGHALPRVGMTATRLADGRVLAAGGAEQLGAPPTGEAFIIDASGTFSPVAPLQVARVSHIAALLPDGRVLAAGGTSYSDTGTVALTSAEIYHPSTGGWSAIQDAPTSVRQSATLSDHRVLAVASDGSVAVFRPASATWCTTDPAPSGVEDLVAISGGSAVALTASGTYRFDAEEPPMHSLTSLDITEARWGISVEADTVTVGGAAATAVGGRWEATTTLPGAQDNPVIIEWKAGPVTRSATANANEVIVPLGGG